MNNKIIWGAVILSVVLGIYAVSKPTQTIVKEVIREVERLGAIPGGDVQGPLNIHGLFMLEPVASTTTYTSSKVTMVAADLERFGVFHLTPSKTLDLTLPASSTLGFIAKNASLFNVVINNDGNSPIAIKSGTGIDLESDLASTTLSAYIESKDSAILTFIKAATTTDWKVFVRSFGDSD